MISNHGNENNVTRFTYILTYKKNKKKKKRKKNEMEIERRVFKLWNFDSGKKNNGKLFLHCQFY